MQTIKNMCYDKALCSGCGSCSAACPRKCIEMRADGEGFLYPEVDKTRCTDCGLCARVCPVLSPGKGQGDPVAYACVCSDEKIRQESSSGGIFTLLAEIILEKGGVVFGAAFDGDWSVAHTAVERREELGRLRGSKYVQSRIGGCYEQAKRFLEAGRPVYFSGTPCQIDGLKAYLQKDYDGLYCQDMVCHGVPSPKIWQAYLGSLKGLGELKGISFRKKEPGWRDFSVSIAGSEKLWEQPHRENPYMKLFLGDISLRPSCYACQSKGFQRRSDLTLGDLWGAESLAGDMDDDKGISLVLVHTPKGRRLLAEAGGRMQCRQIELPEAAKGNPCLLSSAACPAGRRKRLFFEASAEKFTKEGFGALAEALTRKSCWQRGKEALWRLLCRIKS